MRSFASAPLRASLTEDDYVAAKSVLDDEVDVVLVTEYLSSPRSISFLARALCFDAPNGVPPTRRDGDGEARQIPSFDAKQPFGGGGTALRPQDWVPDDAHLARLFQRNALDLRLFDDIARRFRENAPPGPEEFPPLMPVDSPAAYKAELIRRARNRRRRTLS